MWGGHKIFMSPYLPSLSPLFWNTNPGWFSAAVESDSSLNFTDWADVSCQVLHWLNKVHIKGVYSEDDYEVGELQSVVRERYSLKYRLTAVIGADRLGGLSDITLAVGIVRIGKGGSGRWVMFVSLVVNVRSACLPRGIQDVGCHGKPGYVAAHVSCKSWSQNALWI